METMQPPHWRRSFFTVIAGQTVSLLGSSAVQFSLIWWLASETASPMMLAFSGLLAFLPQMLLGPFAGVWIDRLKRKTVLIGADLFTGLVATAFAAMFFVMEQPPYWTACVALGLRAVGGVFHTPAMQATIPLLVPREELVRAGGWGQFLQSGSFMLGPVIGAAMYAALPLPVILLTDLFGALVAALAVALVHLPELPLRRDAAAPNVLRELKEGAAVYARDRKLCFMTACITIGLVFFLPLSSFYPLMTSDYFQGTAWQGSLVELLYAAGMMLSALLTGMLGRMQNKLAWVHLGLLGIGATSLLCGLLPPTAFGYWAFAVLCMLMGASGNLYGIPYTAYLQETIPPELQGRAFSLMGSVMSFAMPIGLLISGPVAEAYGVPLWCALTGAVFLLTTAVSWWYVKRRQTAGR